MRAIQWFRQKFGLDPQLSDEQLYCAFLKKSSKLASLGKAEIYTGGYKVLEKMLGNSEDHVFILVIKGSKIQKPKELKEWFKDYK